jgi:hypothetical protein
MITITDPNPAPVCPLVGHNRYGAIVDLEKYRQKLIEIAIPCFNGTPLEHAFMDSDFYKSINMHFRSTYVELFRVAVYLVDNSPSAIIPVCGSADCGLRVKAPNAKDDGAGASPAPVHRLVGPRQVAP